MTPEHELQAFFSDFVAAFASFDGQRVAQRYAAPYLALNASDEAQVFATPQEIAAYFQQVLDGYAAQGCSSCRFDELEFVPLGTGSLLASVTWELLGDAGQVLSRWRESYNLTRGKQGLRIHASTDHAN
ncbi:hypothetical protein [Pseudomonas sp. Gutcm_11s]|uniref:hypothetical protein n=1 Tax=Pseudomonas sp. Gutcm_11s TaxID=3026088 RepID=UPI00236214BD|nr:hypothetical protein [Pseudomonas sp. Gutcm_11s]MDD0841770.1 hypothetical protein [Pseudomonas sp. Gutcm_11s]